MKEWFRQRKALMMFLGVVYILLALFVVSAYVKNSIDYRKSIYSANAENIDIELEKLPADNRGLLDILTDMFQGNIKDVLGNISVIGKYFDEYVYNLKPFSIAYGVAFLIILICKKSEKEYEGVEHGSAEWATGGEEYSVLSKSEGFILAKDHFLPVIPKPPSGKNGNILIIGGSGSRKICVICNS